ncbi:MAG TPA: hypothetical protein VM284_05180 [Candidatus Limnocylindria bacterium]|nr:hypothetical protein [Candidatus Limnocylindria bacterium]
MVADGRLINPGDGPESSDEPRPGDVDLARAVDENARIGNVAGLDPAMDRSMTDDEGADIEDDTTDRVAGMDPADSEDLEHREDAPRP